MLGRALLAVSAFLTNAAFVGRDEAPRVAADGRALRQVRALEPSTLDGWRALRDRDTGAVARMWGRALDTPGAMLDPQLAERAARDFLARHLARLAPGAALGDFVVVANRIDGRVRTVAFAQHWNGLRVVGGQLHVLFANDRLFFAGSEALPDVRVAGDRRAPRAGLRRTEAWLPGATVAATGERAVLPIVGAATIEYRIVDVAEARAGLERWRVYVAPDGTPLLRERTTARATSTLRFDVGVRRPTGPRALVPAGRASVVANGARSVTGDDGVFAWTGSTPASVTPAASGPLVAVVNAAGAPATAQLSALPDAAVDWSLASDELGDAQLTAFVYATLGKARARAMHPTLAWLDQTLQVHVNEGASCNALSTGDDLHFFRADATCENTARLADVVLHELAHSLHAQTIIPGAGGFDAALSEGISDFFAAHVSGDSGVGRGFYFDDTPVRELDPPERERAFPDDVSGSPHATGLIVGGALWDLRQALVAALGPVSGQQAVERIYIGILQRASDLPTAYLAALVADDDDGDLGNGTPNGCAIEAAFGRHGLAGDDFVTTELAAPRLDGRRVAVDVVTPASTTCAKPAVVGMTLDWQVGDGTPAPIAMAQTGATWTAELPDQPAGTVVTYRIVATLDDGSRRALPDNPADPRYQLFVGEATRIWCETFEQAALDWTQTGRAEWDHAAPAGFGGDPDVAYEGTRSLGTDLVTNGLYAGSGETAIETPPIDARSYGRVHLQFRRWLGVEDSSADQATIAISNAVVWQNATAPDGDLDHVDREWRFVDLEVTRYAAVPFTIRWSLVANEAREFAGWNLDEVCVVGLDKRPRCGDGVVDETETCDDGNTVNGDACSARCEDEPDPGCCSTGGDPRGAVILGLGVIALTLRRRRRS